MTAWLRGSEGLPFTCQTCHFPLLAADDEKNTWPFVMTFRPRESTFGTWRQGKFEGLPFSIRESCHLIRDRGQANDIKSSCWDTRNARRLFATGGMSQIALLKHGFEYNICILYMNRYCELRRFGIATMASSQSRCCSSGSNAVPSR